MKIARVAIPRKQFSQFDRTVLRQLYIIIIVKLCVISLIFFRGSETDSARFPFRYKFPSHESPPFSTNRNTVAISVCLYNTLKDSFRRVLAISSRRITMRNTIHNTHGMGVLAAEFYSISVSHAITPATE